MCAVELYGGAKSAAGYGHAYASGKILLYVLAEFEGKHQEFGITVQGKGKPLLVKIDDGGACLSEFVGRFVKRIDNLLPGGVH